MILAILIILAIFLYIVSIYTTAIIAVDYDIDMSLLMIIVCFCPILNTWISIKYGKFNNFRSIFNKLKKKNDRRREKVIDSRLKF